MSLPRRLDACRRDEASRGPFEEAGALIVAEEHRAEVVECLLAGVGVVGREVESVVPRGIPLELLERFPIGQVVGVLEDEDADDQTDGLVGPPLVLVEVRTEPLLVDERQRRGAERVGPRFLEARALRGVHPGLDAEEGALGRGAA